MPIEIIKRMQKEREEETARQNKIRQEEEERQKRIAEEAEKKRLEAIEKRQQFVLATNQEIEQESNLFIYLQKIDKELLEGNVNKHQVFYFPESGKCGLVWGSNFVVDSKGQIQGNYDYSSIEIQIDPDERTITINATNLTILKEKEWSNAQLLELKLAEAYMEPRRHTEYRESYSSDRDEGGCCCCSAN